jgi:transposase, IS30 family
MAHLTVAQRYTIAVMVQAGDTQKVIADAIGKDKSVVCRELRRNCDGRNGQYTADLAQRKYIKRLKEKPKKEVFTPEIQERVDLLLAKNYSPEQIVGRMRREDCPIVSCERIYQYVWADKKRGGNLHEYLRRRGRKYAKRGSSKKSRGILKNRVDISERPSIVDKKERFGDLEIDTVIGKDHQGALLTINDRVSGKVWIRLLSGKESEPLTQSAIAALLPFKEQLHTITSDNGKEFAGHERIAQELEIQMFFAKPYHSWERGANENTNGLIRQYFRKGCSFENITEKDVEYVENELNNRPRKKLSYLSPNEFYKAKFEPKKVAFET